MARARALAATVVLAALASCGAKPSTAPRDEIRIAIPSDIHGTNPGIDRDAVTDMVLAHVVEGLVAYDERLKVVPMLADRYEVSPDGLRYSFTLRSGIRFQNGRPVTAHDVKWSWERLLSPASQFRCKDFYDGSLGLKLTGIATPDPRTVVFTLARPSSLLLERMANFQCMVGIIHPDSVDAGGQWRRLIATGPYAVQEWKRGSYVLLTRFDGYRPRPEPESGYGGAKIAYARQLRWMIIPDPTAAKAALYSGGIDVVNNLQPSERDELRRSDMAIHESPGLEWNVLLIQTRDPLLRDLRIRRALALAIDFAALARAGTSGDSPANPSVIPTTSPYHDAIQAAGYRHDPAAARALLQAAGYDGQPIHLQTNKRYQVMFDNAIIIQSMLRDAGFVVKLDVLDWTTQLANAGTGQFQLMSFMYSGRTDPVFAYETILGSKDSNPWTQWESPPADRLIEQAGAEADPRARQALFDSVHRRMLGDVPILNLFNGLVIDATSRRLVGYRAWPAAKPRLWGVRLAEAR